MANTLGGSVTELDTSTGALVRVISGARYELGLTDAMAASGTNLFVANFTSRVTEIVVATGDLVRVFSDPEYAFDGPDAVVVSGHDLFVANSGGYSITKFPA